MTKTDNRRFICLSSLIIVGDIILCLSFTKNTTDDVLGIIAAFILSVVAVLLIKKGTELWGVKQFKYKQTLSVVFLLAAALLLVTVAVFTVYNFSRYAANIMLSTKEIFLPFVTFAGLAVLIASSDKNLLLKLSLLLFPAVVIFIIVMFAFSAQFMNVKYLLPYKTPDGAGFLKTFLPLFLSLVSSAVPMLVMGKENKKRSFLWSYLFGIGLLMLCIVNTLGIFGGELASTLSYPYSQAVSTASMGEIFSRLDGFLYAVCFFTGIVKTSACIFSAVYLLRSALARLKK